MRVWSVFAVGCLQLLTLSIADNAAFQAGDAYVNRLPIEGASCFNVSHSSDPNAHQFSACLPRIMVGGVKKCGTSALFQLLATHPSALPTANKELCLHQSNFLQYLQKLPQVAQASNKMVVSGCLFENDTLHLYRALGVSELKVILTVRDIAEQAWAAYNFWCEPSVDQGCKREWGWTTSSHYRSPEMFHEIVKAQQKQPDIKLWMPGLVSGAPTYYKDVVMKWIKQFGDENVLVISQYDLEARGDVVWQQLAQFTGLSPNHSRLDQWRARRYNTQDSKGSGKFKPASKHTPSVYPASGFQPMLNETRALLGNLWRADCLWLRSKYGLQFPSCAVADAA